MSTPKRSAFCFITSIFSLILFTSGIACQNKASQNSILPGTALSSIETGAHPFTFNYQKVTDFLIVKADPVTGDRWTARLARPDSQTLDWEIKTDQGEHPLLDRRADGHFVMHLLDTLQSLRVATPHSPGPLESLGLSPPRFALQWQSAGQDFEVRLGLPIGKGETAYAWVPGKEPFTIEGATLQMLEYLKDFNSLRLKAWTGLLSDDVDEIEIRQGGKPVFYAQREGSDWTDRKHRVIKSDVTAWLNKLTHSQVKRFVDDATQAALIRADHAHPAFREATLTDRQGKAVKLRLLRLKMQLFGLSEARPEGVFELYPETERSFEQPGR